MSNRFRLDTGCIVDSERGVLSDVQIRNTLNKLNDENEELKIEERKLYNYFKDYFDNISEESFKESWELIKDKRNGE